MEASAGSAGGIHVPFRLTTGLNLLDEWSARATQAERNVVHEILFSVTGWTVCAEYPVIDDVSTHLEFFVLARCDLAVKIRIHDFSSYGVVYVGPASAAPGLDQADPDDEAAPGFPAAGSGHRGP